MLYFDHNATTPVDARVAAVFDRAQRELFGNPSSMHRAGQHARRALEQSRRNIANVLGVDSAELIFTSGGTEANNLAIRGILAPGMHAVTSMIEHPAVLEPFRQLEREGVAVTYVRVNSNGVVDAADVAAAIRPETALVSLMAANNETGALQPIVEVAAIVKALRLQGQRILFHSDGVQAAGKMPLQLSPFDLFSISGHKLCAPKGIGILHVRKGIELQPLQRGGRHERGLRAGTENVCGAVALECALGLCSLSEQHQLGQLRDEFERELVREVPDCRVNAGAAARLGNTSNVLFADISAEALLIALDMRGMCVSTGSACSSGSVEPSPVLLHMGLTPKQARASIRFSFGRGNTSREVSDLVNAIALACNRIREKQLV